MHSINYQTQISKILKECEHIVNTYPSPFKDNALNYMKSLNIIESEKRKGGFCYNMPFWFENTFKLKEEYSYIIALGNCFALLYFMAQDEIYDNKNDDTIDILIPLSNLFYLDFISCYRKLFNSESYFWVYFNKYIQEWAISITWEKKEHYKKANDYSEEDLITLSRKASPLKIPYTAICFLTNHKDYINNFEDMVDYDQAAYQMVDDWFDWKKDIKNSSYTYLLVEAYKYCNLETPLMLEEIHVNKAIYFGNIMDKIIKKALHFLDLANESISKINIPYLKIYLEQEKKLCNSIASSISKEKDIIHGNSLNNFVLNLNNKKPGYSKYEE